MSLILISGGSGLIGRNLTRHLLDRGHEVIILSRHRNRTSQDKRIRYSYWDASQGVIDAAVVNEADHIIHLAGAGVMDKKWTRDYKNTILKSRTATAELIIKSINQPHHIQSFVSASAIGYYGPDPEVLNHPDGFSETDQPSDDFLGETCVRWEAASNPVTSMGIRLVTLRTGIVLDTSGGAFKEYIRPLRFGVATIFGNGKQMTSWIHIDDLCRLYADAVEQPYMTGVYNAVAPQPITHKKFMLQTAKKIRNRFFTSIYIPRFLLKLALGDRSIELLKSATISSKKIKTAGFTFLYPTLDSALDELKTRIH